MSDFKIWKNKQTEKGAKLISFWAEIIILKKIKEMMSFYKIYNRKEFIISLIEKQYSIYLKEKATGKPIPDSLFNVYERLNNIENKVFKNVSIVRNKKDYIRKENINKILSKRDIGYNLDIIDDIIIVMKKQSISSKKIADHLNKNKFTTKTGLKIDDNFVNKRIYRLKEQSFIWL